MEPFRSLLRAAAALDRCASAPAGGPAASPATARSTRVLVKLIEGWCIDQAVRGGHRALRGIPRDQYDDTAVLAALRRYIAD